MCENISNNLLADLFQNVLHNRNLTIINLLPNVYYYRDSKMSIFINSLQCNDLQCAERLAVP